MTRSGPSGAAPDGIETWFQPIVNRDGRVEAVEALARRRVGDRIVGAGEFVPGVERSGEMLPLTLAVLDAGLQMAEMTDPRVSVNVNVSQTLLDDRRFVASIESAGATAPSVLGRLCLEVTETAFLPDLTPALDRLRELRSLGCSIAIDDFGTGYASLVLLRAAVADSLKVDQTFVADLVENPLDRAIVAAVVTMGHAVGARIVAEGVDDVAKRDIVFDLGCDAAQGNLFGAAVPAAEMVARLSAEVD